MKLVAEVGFNHMGKMDIALEMIAAASPHVDYLKFQKRHARTLLDEVSYSAPHPSPENSFGRTYGEHRENLELDLKQHRQLFEFCREKNVGYACSVWDIPSALEIISLAPDYLKIPSACNYDFELLSLVAKHYVGSIHISLGMLNHAEIDHLYDFLKELNVLRRVVFYSCTTGYPVAIEDLSLLEITHLYQKYNSQISGIGFSGHHQGIHPDSAALALGASWIERHFTLDKSWKGTDHHASLDLKEIQNLSMQLHSLTTALHLKNEDRLKIEKALRKKLAPYVKV